MEIEYNFYLHHPDKLHLHILIKIRRGGMQAIQTDLTNDAQQNAMCESNVPQNNTE